MLTCCAGPDTAKLVATKAKGLPRIAISLDAVAASALSDVIADFSLALYAAYKTRQEQAATGSCCLFKPNYFFSTFIFSQQQGNFIAHLYPQFCFPLFCRTR